MKSQLLCLSLSFQALGCTFSRVFKDRRTKTSSEYVKISDENKQTNNKGTSHPHLLSCLVNHQIQEKLWDFLGQAILQKYFDAHHRQYFSQVYHHTDTITICGKIHSSC